MSQYQFVVNGATDTGALSWYANGNLEALAITDNVPGTADSQTCGYTHDDMGRVAGVSCGAAWGQTFGFDSFGNIQKSGSQSFGATYNTNNQISTNINFTPNYDLDGNLLDDPISGSRGVNSFDVEGRAVTLEGVGVVYDALGRAVEAATPGGTVEFVYGPGGVKLAVMNGQSLVRADVPMPGGGEAVYNASGFAYFRHADHLGSSRLATTASRTLYTSTAYAPFGEAYGAAGTQDRSFTGQKQDIDSSHSGGQYDMLYRDLNADQGRWWTPDPAGLAAVDPGSPQSWNRYGYANGMPLLFADRNGLDPCASSGLALPTSNRNADGVNFGPSAEDDGNAPQQAGCGQPVCTIDGTVVGCGWAQAELGSNASIEVSGGCAAFVDCVGQMYSVAGNQVYIGTWKIQTVYSHFDEEDWFDADGDVTAMETGLFYRADEAGGYDWQLAGTVPPNFTAPQISYPWAPGSRGYAISPPGTAFISAKTPPHYPRSDGALVSCEFATTYDKIAVVGTINVAPFAWAATGNVPRVVQSVIVGLSLTSAAPGPFATSA